MSKERILASRMAALAAVFLAAIYASSTLASVPGPDDIKARATDKPVVLFISLCLWSQQHPSPTCREVPLTPGAAGPAFVNMKACQDGQDEALRKWRTEAGPVFGYTGMAGDGYRIDAIYCGPVVSSSPISDVDE
jgi:hypothetical protein